MGAETYATRTSRSVLTGPRTTTTTGHATNGTATRPASGSGSATAPAQVGPLSVMIAPAATRTRLATPEPRLRQLMGVCGWAAVLGGLGLVIGLRSLIGFITATPPGWYEPSVIATGGLGLAFSVGAFLTVRRPRVPWIMLSLSTVFLIAAMVLTSKAF